MSEFFVVEPCNTAKGIEIKLKEKRLDLARAEKVFAKLGEVVGSSPVVLLVKIGAYHISVYGSGRMMVKNAKKTEMKKIGELAREVIDELGKAGAIL